MGPLGLPSAKNILPHNLEGIRIRYALANLRKKQWTLAGGDFLEERLQEFGFADNSSQGFRILVYMQYQPWKVGPWIGFSWRYDSGLVAGPAPCARGNCANGPAGTDMVVDTSGLSADQQFESGLFCGSVHPALPTPGNPVGTPMDIWDISTHPAESF